MVALEQRERRVEIAAAGLIARQRDQPLRLARTLIHIVRQDLNRVVRTALPTDDPPEIELHRQIGGIGGEQDAQAFLRLRIVARPDRELGAAPVQRQVFGMQRQGAIGVAQRIG